MMPMAPTSPYPARSSAPFHLFSLSVAVALALGCARGSAQRASANYESPRIARLAREIAASGQSSVDRFWREMATKGPIVEPLGGTRDTLLVTYVWRGDEKTTGVSLSGGVPEGCGEKPLQRLAGSDVWYRSERTPGVARFSYRFRVNAPLEVPRSYGDIAAREQRYPPQPDPLNPDVHPLDGSMVRLGGAEQRGAPSAAVRLRGRLHDSTIASAALGGSRPVWIYTPPGFEVGSTRYPLLVVLDGRVGTNGLRIPAVLEELVERGTILPTVAVFVGNPSPLVRADDYMGSAEYTAFLANELVALMRARYAVDSAPGRHAIVGVSLGGLAALFAAHARPDQFGAVVSLSGAHWYRPSWRDAAYPLTEAEGWLTRRIAETPRRPMRVFLAAGALESQCPYPYLAANRKLAEVLGRGGYDARYVEYVGGHDVENWRALVPTALEYVLGNRGS